MVSHLDRKAIDWLLASEEPGVRYMTRVELCGERADSSSVRALAKKIQSGPKVSRLLAFEDVHPYRSWVGAHWRLVSLVELGLPPDNSRAREACNELVELYARSVRRSPPRVLNGRVRRHAAVEGFAVVVACRLNMARDERVGELVEALLSWQWPDGGWNCDSKAKGHRSSFHESLTPAWALFEYDRATKEPRCLEAVMRAAELFLDHQLWKTTKTKAPIHPSFGELHWPAYWKYDVLQAMRVLAQVGVLSDPRCDDAFDLLASKRGEDGCWRADGRWWKPPGSKVLPEAVDWSEISDQMVTLNALRAERARRKRRHPISSSP